VRILIGTPVYDDQVLVPYHLAVTGLRERFRETRPEVRFESLLPGSTLITRARNALATIMLSEQRYTHLLFIDADMGFRPELIEKMLDFGEPLVGCIYPQRIRADPQPFVSGADVFVREDGGAPKVRGDFIQVLQAGTGIMLIRRDALELLSERFPKLWSKKGGNGYAELGVEGRVFQIFEPGQRPEDGFYLSEDISFCRRWVNGCGGEVWACFNEAITHAGRDRVTARYSDHVVVDQVTVSAGAAPLKNSTARSVGPPSSRPMMLPTSVPPERE
jgi:hypothetical protein